jgi:hypothetical protein
MPISSADLCFMLSGGAENADPSLSLGGDIALDATVPDRLFPDVGAVEAQTGSVRYRCVFIKNNDNALTLAGARFWVLADGVSPGLEMDVGLGLGGVDGAEPVIASDVQPPSGIEFVPAPSYDEGLYLGDIPAGSAVAVWLRRTLEGGVTTSIPIDYFVLCVRGEGDMADEGWLVGPPGATPNLTIGTVERGDDAGASMSGTVLNPVLNLVLPKGDQGEQGVVGPTPNITVGTVTTGDAGSQAAASMSGTALNPVLDMTIPRGDVGASPTLGIGTVATGTPGSNAEASVGGTALNRVLNLLIPRGDKGEQGDEGPPGDAYKGLFQSHEDLEDIPVDEMELGDNADVVETNSKWGWNIGWLGDETDYEFADTAALLAWYTPPGVLDFWYNSTTGTIWQYLPDDDTLAYADRTYSFQDTGVSYPAKASVEFTDEGLPIWTGDPDDEYNPQRLRWFNALLPVSQQGPKGDPGEPGAVGPTVQLVIGEVTTGAPGTDAEASLTGSGLERSLNLTLPQGAQGPAGVMPDVALTAETGTGADTTTPAVASGAVATVLQTIWNKIRQVANAAMDAANIVTGTLPIARGGTGLSAANSVLTNLASTTAATTFAAAPRPGVTGTLPVANGGTGQTTLALARNAMGLGNTTGALPVANGGTGVATVAGDATHRKALCSPKSATAAAPSWVTLGALAFVDSFCSYCNCDCDCSGN